MPPVPSRNGHGPATPTPDDVLRPFRWHGIDIDPPPSGDQAVATCPFCDKPKFFVNVTNGLWDCKVCGAKGNPLDFLRQLWEASDKATTDYHPLIEHRGLLEVTTPASWNVARSIITGEWLVPGYHPDGRLVQLYRYVKGPTGKSALWATAGFGHGLHGVGLFDPKKSDVFVCEGVWDAMAWWEMLGSCKYVDLPGGMQELGLTANPDKSLLAEANVLAVPGCNVWVESWGRMLAGKNVVLCYDNDHPRIHPKTNQLLEPVGWAAMKRVAHQLSSQEQPPNRMAIIRWGEDATEYNSDLADGFDLRDAMLAGGATATERIRAVDTVLQKVVAIPEDWVQGRTPEAKRKGGYALDLAGARSWAEVVEAGSAALEWIDGLDKTLSVMLASVLSTKSLGIQLWVKVIGPPSCGKSELCEAVSANQTYVRAISSIKGFHSGYKVDKDGSEDVSLISQLRDMTLVTKDGDTLITTPNLPQILAEARDIYDRVSRTHYRNNMGRDYMNLNMTWVLCGTESLRVLDSSELGERFLDCVVVEELDEDLERRIALMGVNQECDDSNLEANGKIESMDNPAKTRFKQVVGGYVNYLRLNANQLLNGVKFPDTLRMRCVRMGEFVSFVRSRPSKLQEEKAQRELCIRLSRQLARLAKCLAVVLNKPEVDEEVIERVRQVALDTARGRVYRIVTELAQRPDEVGLDTKSLALLTHQKEDKERDLLKFMRKIKVVDLFQRDLGNGARSVPKWRLTPRVRKLYDEILGAARPTEVTPLFL